MQEELQHTRCSCVEKEVTVGSGLNHGRKGSYTTQHAETDIDVSIGLGEISEISKWKNATRKLSRRTEFTEHLSFTLHTKTKPKLIKTYGSVLSDLILSYFHPQMFPELQYRTF